MTKSTFNVNTAEARVGSYRVTIVAIIVSLNFENWM